ncbi:MAG: hypothetical protein JWM34_2530 [Ilumatobacteraceae bacterium]|nr:hypothetical protein [Ilumatobacteraceae bacterium]
MGGVAAGRVRYASVCDDSGYSVAATRCIESLRSVGVPVAWEPMLHTQAEQGLARRRVERPVQFAEVSPLRDLQSDPADDETLIVHAMPNGTWRRARGELRPPRMIGHFVWESDRLPRTWIPELATADELWVPTEWNAATVRESGLDRPVHVLPHATAPFVDDPVDPTCPRPDVPADHFVFVMVSAWDWRKRPDRTIDAFLTAFGEDDPVTLVVKTHEDIAAWSNDDWRRAPLPVWRHVLDVIRRHPHPASIVLDTAPWTQATMRWMLDRADCFLSLTSTEGWGLGAFDAACLGTPVIITGYGGQVEWLGSDYPGLVPYELEPVTVSNGTSFEPEMCWARPDVDAAVEAMRALADGRSAGVLEAASRLAPQLRQRYSPAAVGATAVRLLG